MISFMILGLPRSGTTWASNWLTEGDRICLHDPIKDYDLEEYDSLYPEMKVGLSCTGTYLFPEWVNRHPARKVILHKNVEEVRRSLKKIMLDVPVLDQSYLQKINGLHVEWTELFTNGEMIYHFLFPGERFNHVRYECLRDMYIQPNFDRVLCDNDRVKKIIHEYRKVKNRTISEVNVSSPAEIPLN